VSPSTERNCWHAFQNQPELSELPVTLLLAVPENPLSILNHLPFLFLWITRFATPFLLFSSITYISFSLPASCNASSKCLRSNSVTLSLLFLPRSRLLAGQYFLALSLVFRQNCTFSRPRGGGGEFSQSAAPRKPVPSFGRSRFLRTMIGLRSISISRLFSLVSLSRLTQLHLYVFLFVVFVRFWKKTFGNSEAVCANSS